MRSGLKEQFSGCTLEGNQPRGLKSLFLRTVQKSAGLAMKSLTWVKLLRFVTANCIQIHAILVFRPVI